MLIGYAAQATIQARLRTMYKSGCLIALLYRKRQVCCTLPEEKQSSVHLIVATCQTVPNCQHRPNNQQLTIQVFLSTFQCQQLYSERKKGESYAFQRSQRA